MIDDVWSGGTSKDGPYPLMSSAIAAGLYHPNCKDSHSTYFPGITTAEDSFITAELVNVEKDYAIEQRQRYIENQVQKYRRMANFAVSREEQAKYRTKEDIWMKKKILDPKDFDIENVVVDGTFATGYDMLFKTMNVLPSRIVDAAKNSTKFKIGEFDACRYDYDRDIMYIAQNAKFEAVVHEFGHLLENKILNLKAVDVIKHEHLRKVNATHIKPATVYDSKDNPVKILYVEYPGMVSTYHGRIYKAKEVKDAFRAVSYLKEELLWEYIAEPFRIYIINPDKLKYLNRPLYDLFEETFR